MTEKYYVIKQGHQTGIFSDAEEVLKQIDDYSNAWIKSFSNRCEAEAFLNEKTKVSVKETLEAYVDGSFSKHTNQYSSGIILIDQGEIIFQTGRVYDTDKYRESHQIAGEVFGAAEAIRKAIEMGYHSIVIYYDYLGIEKWATGEWKANKPVSQDYVTFIQTRRPQIDIHFKKVKAHTGNRYNELADQLAKDALK